MPVRLRKRLDHGFTLLGAAASLTEWNVEAFEFLDLVTDADTQFETSARNRVDHRVSRRGELGDETASAAHPAVCGCAWCVPRDRCGRRQHRGQVTVVDEAMLTQPDVVEAVLTPCDLVRVSSVICEIRLTAAL